MKRCGLFGAKTKRQPIKDALQAQVDRAKRIRLLATKGKIDLNVNLDELRNRHAFREILDYLIRAGFKLQKNQIYK